MKNTHTVEGILVACDKSEPAEKVGVRTTSERGQRACELLEDGACHAAGQNPVGNAAFVAAVKASMKAESTVKLRYVVVVSI